jgi:hypothetical protein
MESPSTTSCLVPGPLFVVGIWRSGTSLLYALLNQNPQIALMYEADFLTLRPVFLLPRSARCWPERFEAWNSSLSRHGIDPVAIPAGISSLVPASEKLYKLYASSRKATVWGEKSPNYYDSLCRLARYFPHARFVVIWRDPAAICRSILRAAERSPWFSKRGMTHRALLGFEIMKTECDRLRHRGAALHEISYGRLIARPQEVMEEVSSFLKIPYDPRMATLGAADRSAIYEGEHHALVKGSNIVRREPDREALPAAFNRKIQRYLTHWRSKYGSQWPALRDFPPSNEAGAGLPERAMDKVLYVAYRSFDLAMRLFYCLAPMPILRLYKAVKQRHDLAALEARKAANS